MEMTNQAQRIWSAANEGVIFCPHKHPWPCNFTSTTNIGLTRLSSESSLSISGVLFPSRPSLTNCTASYHIALADVSHGRGCSNVRSCMAKPFENHLVFWECTASKLWGKKPINPPCKCWSFSVDALIFTHYGCAVTSGPELWQVWPRVNYFSSSC